MNLNAMAGRSITGPIVICTVIFLAIWLCGGTLAAAFAALAVSAYAYSQLLENLGKSAELAQSQAQYAELASRLEAAEVELADRTYDLNNSIEAARVLEAELDATRQEALLAAETASNNDDEARMRERIAGLADRLISQISVAIDEVEPAVVGAIESFVTISCDVQAIADRAGVAIKGDEDSGVARVINMATEVMNDFVRHMLVTANEVADAATEMQSLVRISADFTALLNEIEAVADQTNLVALNAGIQAARAGSQGRAFTVVAGAIRKLSDRSRASAARARELTSNFSRATLAICNQLGGAAKSSSAEGLTAHGELIQLTSAIKESDRRTTELLSTLSNESTSISREITRIVIAMQFHDLLRQRLEHVAGPLCDLRDDLQSRPHDEILPDVLPIAVGQAAPVRRGAGWAPGLHIVKFDEVSKLAHTPAAQDGSTTRDDDDNVVLF